METTNPSYRPPRLLALSAGLGVFVIYQWVWRPNLIELSNTHGHPVPLPAAFGFALILGYALAMLWWLIRQTRGQFWATFRPTRGRIISAICLALVTPMVVVNWLPWIILLAAAPVVSVNIGAVALMGAACLIVYPLAAMILRHTYQRRLLRLGLFSLYFWGVYACLMLWHGVIHFTL